MHVYIHNKILESGEEVIPDITEEWQFLLRDTIWDDENVFNMRTVVWIFDRTGNSEQSTFIKHMWYRDLTNVHVVNKLSPTDSFLLEIKSVASTGWNGSRLICNLIGKDNNEDIYESLEFFKNKRVVYSACANTLVFADFPPDINQMSVDRWRIYELVDKNLIFRFYEDFIGHH